MRRAGIAEETIMKIGGWKTSSVFKRYAIVDHSDIQDAAAKIQKREEIIAAAAAERLQNSYSANERAALQRLGS